MDHCCYKIASLLIVWLVPLGALAQTTPATPAAPTSTPLPSDELETTRGLALGTGARASAASTSAHAYNPAAMPLTRTYHIEGLVGYSPSANLWSLGSAIVDSSTNKLAMGLSFRGLIGAGDYSYNGFDGRASLAIPLAEFLSVGVAGRYFSLESNAQGPDGEDGPTLGRGFTIDASIALQPVNGLRLAVLGNNLIDVESSLAPTLIGGGLSYQFGDVFMLGGDVLVDMTTFVDPKVIGGGGAEYLAGGTFPIRLGYRYDQGRSTHTVTGGVGYVDQKVGFDFSMSQDVSGDGESETQLLLGLRYFVH
ncbi:MAG: hypothetical protein AAGF12_05010 [Myxococcota bacterium]